MVTTKQILKVLEDAYHLLDKKSRWTMGMVARDGDNNPCNVRGLNAVAFCAIGALQKVNGPPSSSTYKAAKKAVDIASKELYSNVDDVIDVNDDLGYKETRNVFRRAIRTLRKGVT